MSHGKSPGISKPYFLWNSAELRDGGTDHVCRADTGRLFRLRGLLRRYDRELERAEHAARHAPGEHESLLSIGRGWRRYAAIQTMEPPAPSLFSVPIYSLDQLAQRVLDAFDPSHLEILHGRIYESDYINLVQMMRELMPQQNDSVIVLNAHGNTPMSIPVHRQLLFVRVGSPPREPEPIVA